MRLLERARAALRLALIAAVLVVCGLPSTAWAQSEPSAISPRDVPDYAPSAQELHYPPLPSTFATRDAGWIRFGYPPSAQGRIDPLIETAVEARAALAAELGRPVLDNVEVRIARTPEELAALAPSDAPPPDYAEGVAYARLRLIIISLVAPHAAEPPLLSEVLRHELAHVALHDAVGGRPVPRWFNEGFAVHASGESSLLRSSTLWKATLSKRLLPMRDLDRTFPASSDLASIAYAQSADFVRFLLRRQDRARFAMFVERLDRGEPFDASLSDAYATDIRRLEFQWRQELSRRYSWVPVFLGGGMLWVGAFVVLGFGYLRRRRDAKRTLARWAREEAEQDRVAAQREPEPLRAAISPRATPGSVAAAILKGNDAELPRVEHNGRWHTLH
jgi:hypothetical protein